MEGLTLLADARAAGLTVLSDGERLVIGGPRKAEALALRLLEAKPVVMAALASESDGLLEGEFTIDLGRGPERWRERTVQRRSGHVRLLERIYPLQQFHWLSDSDFDDLPNTAAAHGFGTADTVDADTTRENRGETEVLSTSTPQKRLGLGEQR